MNLEIKSVGQAMYAPGFNACQGHNVIAYMLGV